MLPEIALVALRYFDRTALEGLQIHSRYLRDLVNRHACTLPLRYIHCVQIERGFLYLRFLEDSELLRANAPVDRGLEMIFRLINNTFIHRLTLSFEREVLPLPYYLRANGNDLQCQIRALHINGDAEEIDYALVDFLGFHLKPQVYEAVTGPLFHDGYAVLFTRSGMRENVKHLEYQMGAAPAPDCIIPELFGVDEVETCAILTTADPRPWIGKFIEMFETVEPATEIVRTVTLVCTRSKRSTLRLDVEPLGQPRRTDVPTPHSAFVREWSQELTKFIRRHLDETTANESTVSNLFVYENAKLAKKLEVYVWTVELRDDDAALCLIYAFLLQVVDV